MHKQYGAKVIYDGFDFMIRRRERWCIMGINGAGKSTLLKLVAGTAEPDAGTVHDRRRGEDGLFRPACDGAARRRAHRVRVAGRRVSAGGAGGAEDARRLLRLFRRRPGEEVPGSLGRREGAAGDGQMLFDPPNLLVLDEPTNHLDLDTKEMLIKALADYEGTMIFVSHDRHFLAALSNRVLELTPDGVHRYDGGYTEYVARTGQEAPGLRH
ncbi:MAG: ATP-binding cassette domain-containing protein [Pseudomonas sp.]